MSAFEQLPNRQRPHGHAGRLAVGQPAKHPVHTLHTLENRVRYFRPRLAFALANHMQHRLGVIRNRLQFCKLKESGQPLNSVESAENRMDRKVVSRVALQSQHLLPNGGELLLYLQSKIGRQFRVTVFQKCGLHSFPASQPDIGRDAELPQR